MRTPFTGLGTALVTPFRQDGSIDEAAVHRLTERQVEAGVHFVSPCGTTGEAPTLSHDEKVRVVQLVVEAVAGRVPVLAGAGGYDTREVIDLARAFERAGADGLLSVSPYYNRPSPEGLYQHYRAVADATGLPIVLYNVPSRTGVNIDVATVARLAEVPHVIGVKEASANVGQMIEILAAVPDEFMLLGGDDPLTVAVMAIGGRGVISVASNAIPAEMVAVMELAERGDLVGARKAHARLLPFILSNFAEANPVPVKAAMAAMGLLEEAYRLPLVPPSPATRERSLRALRELNLVAVSSPAPGR
jgi:4-hydroxy-tetrahydrodipicolinate synthase